MNLLFSVFFKLLTALKFFASGSYQQYVGEYRGASVNQSSVSRWTTEIVNALNGPEILNKYINFLSAIGEFNEICLG